MEILKPDNHLTPHLRNISIGNNYTVEEPAYLKMKGISHVLNTCGKESEPDTARVNPFHFQNNGLQHLSLEVSTEQIEMRLSTILSPDSRPAGGQHLRLLRLRHRMDGRSSEVWRAFVGQLLAGSE